MAIQNPLTGYEPKQPDNFDYTEAYTTIFQNESVDIETEPSYSFDVDPDDELIRKTLSSPLYTQEREEPADLRQIYHSHEESLSPAQSFFTRTSTGQLVTSVSQKRKSNHDLESEKIQVLLERQKEQILAEVRSEIQKHESQADSDRRSIHELTGIIDSQEREIGHTLAGYEQSRRDHALLQEELSEQNRILRETRIRNMRDKEEMEKSHVLQVDEFSRGKLIERIQELQNEVNCMNDSRDFKDAESVRSGLSHVPSQPALLPFPLPRDPGGLLSRTRNKPQNIWNPHGTSGNVFANPQASSSTPYSGVFNPWVSNVTEDTPVRTSTGKPLHVVKAKFQTQS